MQASPQHPRAGIALAVFGVAGFFAQIPLAVFHISHRIADAAAVVSALLFLVGLVLFWPTLRKHSPIRWVGFSSSLMPELLADGSPEHNDRPLHEAAQTAWAELQSAHLTIQRLLAGEGADAFGLFMWERWAEGTGRVLAGDRRALAAFRAADVAFNEVASLEPSPRRQEPVVPERHVLERALRAVRDAQEELDRLLDAL